jgi:hypothetical protein
VDNVLTRSVPGKPPRMTDPYRPTVRTQADLEQVWRHLMEPLGFGGWSVWMMRIASDGLAAPHLLEITEADDAPASAEEADSFAELLRDLDTADPGGSFAFLRSRPGRGIDGDDRAWATFLYDTGRAAGVRLEVVHLATDVDLVPLPLDEVGLSRSA